MGSWPGCAAPAHPQPVLPELSRDFNLGGLCCPQGLLALCALLHWEMSQLHISLCPALPAVALLSSALLRIPFLLSFQTDLISGRCKAPG